MTLSLEKEIKELQEWADNNIVLHPDVKIKITQNYNVKESREEYTLLVTLPDGNKKFLGQYIDNTMRGNFETMKGIKKVFIPGMKRSIADLLMHYKPEKEQDAPITESRPS